MGQNPSTNLTDKLSLGMVYYIVGTLNDSDLRTIYSLLQILKNDVCKLVHICGCFYDSGNNGSFVNSAKSYAFDVGRYTYYLFVTFVTLRQNILSSL